MLDLMGHMGLDVQKAMPPSTITHVVAQRPAGQGLQEAGARQTSAVSSLARYSARCPGLWSSCLSLAIFRSCACWDCSRSVHCYVGQGHKLLLYQRVNDQLHLGAKGVSHAAAVQCGILT